MLSSFHYLIEDGSKVPGRRERYHSLGAKDEEEFGDPSGRDRRGVTASG